MSAESLVLLANVVKKFESQSPPAVDHLNASIPKGEFVGLAGPDGAGKTTLMRLIAGLLKPTEGTIRVAGYDTIADASALHEIIGYMPQKFGLYEDLTVQQNLNLYADLRGVAKEERKKSFERLLAFTNLAPFTTRLAGKLSGGMKQKLGLACALIKRPALLLLDEPSVGVDPLSRRELWKMVHELLDEGISVIWSTAYLEEAERCHTVLLLNEGLLVYKGQPEELTQKMKERVFGIAHFEGNRRQILLHTLEQKNVIDGLIQGETIRVVVREQKEPPFDLQLSQAGPSAKIVPLAPRFEDAFLDILGGGPPAGSLLADKTPQIDLKDVLAIEAQGLTKRFGTFVAADHIDLKIPCGEIFGFLGPNGAGKTTTFKMLCGLLKPSEGKALVNGMDLQKAPGKARAQIGYMAQKFSLYDHLSVQQNLEFFSGIYGLSGHTKEEAIQEMVTVFDFHRLLKESTQLLPLGFKQRLALACAVMHHPKVLFLDEPTSGVDPLTRREFWNHINGLVEKGVTVMVTTHFMDEAEYCDRIGLIYQSQLIRVGTPEELKRAARTQEDPSPTLETAFIQLIENYDKR